MTNYQRGQRLLCGDYSSYTPTGSSYFKKAGRWGTTPHAGDIIYFYTASLGRISHVGIVESAQYANGVWLSHRRHRRLFHKSGQHRRFRQPFVRG